MERSLRTWRGSITVMGVEVVARGKRCSSCGETLIRLRELQQADRKAAAQLVKRGIRKGVEFRFVRKLADLRANELAEMLDVRPETVSRWERGEIAIPRATGFVLGTLFEHPVATRRKLSAFGR